MFDKKTLEHLKQAVCTLEQGFDTLPDFLPSTENHKHIERILNQLAVKLHDNYPYQHPLYAGQMLKPPHPIARLAYQLAQFINPNNHALDGGRATSELEKQCVAKLAAMFGWEAHLGHLTSSGTMGNLEALWVAGQIHPNKLIVASEQAHYTHKRISNVLQIPYQDVSVDSEFKIDLNHLEELLKTGNVGTVVVTLGTTGVGAVDPLQEIIELQKIYDFRVHVDAAYGGYFKLVSNIEPSALLAFECIEAVDSIVIDPHKHGLQPYGCGCVIYKDPGVGKIYKHDSPYTYFTSDELHLGEISLECSRAGASAAALWATMELLPLTRDGQFAQNLSLSPLAAQELFLRLDHSDEHITVIQPQLDIVVWAPKANSVSAISNLARSQFKQAAANNLHLALINLPRKLVEPNWVGVEWDDEYVTCLRSCLMKPEHLAWIDEIWALIANLDSV
jgi:tyrosine decarboxylase / aspartate 1-decarboxylase